MTPIQLAAFHAHALLPTFRQRVTEARAVVDQIDPTCTFVGFSAGKDSAVIAHLCHEAHPGIAMLMVDPGIPTHWIQSDRDAWLSYAETHGWNLRLFPWDKWGVDRRADSVETYQAHIHNEMFADLQNYAKQHALTDRVMGLRKEESRARAILVNTRGTIYDYAAGGRAYLPIARWRTIDVWAYIVTHELPWLDIYDRLGPQARNGLVGRSGEAYGRIEYLREAYPDVWRWAVARGILG